MVRGASRRVQIIITEPQPGAAERLQQQLSMRGNGNDAVEVLGVARDGLEAAQMAAQLTPDVILLYEQMPALNGYEACEMISLAAPDVASVLLVADGQATNPDIQRNALRAGARAVLPQQSTGETLIETLANLSQLVEAREKPEYQLITDPDKMPMTIAVTGAKGGIGKSMISCNLAVLFARNHPGEVALVDFYGQFGNMPLMLDLSPSADITALAAFANELDANIVESHLTTHAESGLKVLAGNPVGEGIGAILSPEQEIAFLAELLGLLRRGYRFVFFDVPPLIGRASTYIYSRAQYIILVSALVDLSTVRDTTSLYNQLLDLHLAPERIKLVVNRANRQADLTIADLQQAIGTRVVHQLPDDPVNAISSINEGMPLVLARSGSPLGRSMRELGQLLEATMAEDRKRKG